MKKYFLLICLLTLTGLNISAEEFSESPDTVKTDSLITIKIQRVFEDIEDEYNLAKIFFTSKQRKQYKSQEKDADKRLFLDTFWAVNDPNPVTPENEFILILRSRIEYCNNHFSHFKDGWKTDMGRIYLKHGQPYEVIKDRTDILGKHGEKEYQIWKYRVYEDMTFIFIDLQTHGDFRLIYSENDERETSYPNWLEYMGRNFDPGILY